jgi:dTDP-4-amino-4,6-dideoxygalactose transaminase
VHMQPAYQGMVMKASTGLGNTEQVCGELLSLPMYPQLGDQLVRAVTRAVSEWAAQRVG